MGLWWYLGWLLTKFFVHLDFPACEHHFYLPGMGIYIIIAALSIKYYSKKKRIMTLSWSIIIIFSILSWHRNGEYTNVLLFWENSVEKNPQSAYLHNELGRVYITLGRSAAAESEFLKAITLSRRESDTYIAKRMLGDVYIYNKQYDKAESILKKLAASNPPLVGVNEHLGIIYAHRSDYNKAIQFWKKEIELYPSVPQAYCDIGLYYLKKSNTAEAETLFLEALNKDPDYYLIYYGLGKIYKKRGNIPLALLYYRKSVKLNRNWLHSHYELGKLYVKIQRLSFAKRELSRAIQIDKNFAGAHNDLAVVYASMNPPRWKLAKKEAVRVESGRRAQRAGEDA